MQICEKDFPILSMEEGNKGFSQAVLLNFLVLPQEKRQKFAENESLFKEFRKLVCQGNYPIQEFVCLKNLKVLKLNGKPAEYLVWGSMLLVDAIEFFNEDNPIKEITLKLKQSVGPFKAGEPYSLTYGGILMKTGFAILNKLNVTAMDLTSPKSILASVDIKSG